jgi:flagellar basal body-associated protein FliL
MADEKTAEKQENPKKTENGTKPEQTKAEKNNQLLSWIIMAVAVVVCASAGFGLSRLLAGVTNKKEQTASAKEQKGAEEKKSTEEKKPNEKGSSAESTKIWYYDLDPVIANLNEPGATRYIRAVVTLQIAAELTPEKGKAFLDEKKPLLINWLNIFFAGLSIEDVRGDKNQKIIQSQILDSFNEKLFPDAKPQVAGILFREFAVQ